ncbi:MAG TPA: glucose 1-dehydrogenase [Smithellaceae bacterium]|nr:glucose 1-dehydrogenase [Smithellaceae bacterium]
MDLKNKVAIVTGGAGGIGASICRVLAAYGAKVVVLHLAFELENAKNVVKDIKAAGGQAIALEADITKDAEVEQAVEKTVKEYGTVHILVNCAGITIDGTVVKLKREHFDKVLAVNLTGAFLTTKAVLPYMISQQDGRIVNISSVIGLIGLRGASAYASSKAGLIAFSKSVAREVAKKGITVNCICPGYINAGLMKGVEKNVLDEMMKAAPMGRIGEPEDIGEGVAFLASARAKYITGQALNIDGGLVM